MNTPAKTIGVLPTHPQTSRRTDKAGFVLCAALLAALAGCTTYVEQPRPVAYEEPPRVQPVPVPPPPVTTSVEVVIRSEEDFYQPLSPYGRWEVVGAYGRCWIPIRVEANWRPYCNGHWERTDAGWYWVSDEPWAWATYHYGRWDFSAQFGWYWVPQTQWAPAWVSWHRGGGYVGWAPLHPSARFGGDGNVEVDVRVIAPRAYVLVEERKFLQPVRPTTVVVNNTTIINKTVNITNVKVVNQTVINEGPQTQIIEKASGRKVQAVPVRELRHRSEAAVVAKQRIAPAADERRVQPPARTEVEPRGRKAQLDAERRTTAAKNAETEAQRNARELEKKAQAEAERRAKESERQAQAEQRNARELERKAQLDSERRASEAKKAEAEAQRNAKGLEKKAQADAARRAKESERQTQSEPQRNTRELERKRQLDAERRANESKKVEAKAQRNAKEMEKKAQADADRRAKESERQAQAEAQRNARELEKKAKLDSEQRAKESKKTGAESQRDARAFEKKAPAESGRGAEQRASERGAKREQDANEQDGTNTVKKAQKKKDKEN